MDKSMNEALTNQSIAQEAIEKITSKYSGYMTGVLPGVDHCQFLEPEQLYQYLQTRSQRIFGDYSQAKGTYDPFSQMILIRDDLDHTEKERVIVHEWLHVIAGQWQIRDGRRLQRKAGLQVVEAYRGEDGGFLRETAHLELNEMFTDLLVAEVLDLDVALMVEENPVTDDRKVLDAFKCHIAAASPAVIDNFKIAYFTDLRCSFWRSLAQVQEALGSLIYQQLFTKYREALSDL